MTREWRQSTPRCAWRSAACVAALAVLVWTLVRALRAEALPDRPPTTLAGIETFRRRAARAEANIQVASRTISSRRIATAPDDAVSDAGRERIRTTKRGVEPMKPSVLGTAVATDGRNFATLQLGDGSSDARAGRRQDR